MRLAIRYLAGAALLLGIASCNRPLVPPSTPAGSDNRHPVKPPARIVQPIVGADIYAKSNYPTSTVRADGRRDLRYAKRFLKLTGIGISWNLFAPSRHSNQVLATASSLSPANVAVLTRIARADGLPVLFRPLVKVEGAKPWEGYLAPADTASWFNSYFHAELPYLLVAQKYHIEEFDVGTELVQLEQSAPTSQWRSFLAKVHHVYSGKVSYATWGTDFYAEYPAIPPTSWYGLTAYPDVALPDSASVPQLTRAWVRVFRYVPPSILVRTAIQEIGIPAGDGAYHAPWAWNRSYLLNEAVQARWFLAACYAARQLKLRGIYFWNLNLTDNPSKPPWPSVVTFEGKRAALAIRECGAILVKPRSGA